MGFEPTASTLAKSRSNQLSYTRIILFQNLLEILYLLIQL